MYLVIYGSSGDDEDEEDKDANRLNKAVEDTSTLEPNKNQIDASNSDMEDPSDIHLCSNGKSSEINDNQDHVNNEQEAAKCYISEDCHGENMEEITRNNKGHEDDSDRIKVEGEIIKSIDKSKKEMTGCEEISKEENLERYQEMTDEDIEKAVKRELDEAVEIRVPKVRTKRDWNDCKWLSPPIDNCKSEYKHKRADTPPLQRLMRQEFSSLKSEKGFPHSPPKRFKDSKSHHEGFTSKLASVIIPSTNINLPPKLASHPKQLLSHSIANLRASSSKSNSFSRSPFSTSSLLSRSFPISQPVFSSPVLSSPLLLSTTKSATDSDQPLDLSKKSGKCSGGKVSLSKSTESYKHENGHSSTSLQSLQQKFGGDYHLRGLRKPLNYMLYGPEIPALHKALLHSASLSLPFPLNFANGFPKIMPEKHRHRNSTPSPNKSKMEESSKTFRRDNPVQKEKSVKHEIVEKTEADSEAGVGMEEKNGENYTNHLCSCGKWFDGLYSLSLHLQETGHLPARNKSVSLLEYPKLVRGQDMWLNQESEQTRRILRCIQCGESFKTLPLLTVHMMKTQHYTQIVSSEHARRPHKCSAYCEKDQEKECVFKCRVCEETFPDMEGLANHMILSGHHKKQSPKHGHHYSDAHFKKRKRYSFEEALYPYGNPSMATMCDFKKQTFGGKSSPEPGVGDLDDFDNKITCENCGGKIEMKAFVAHVRACLGQKLKEDVSRLEKEKENIKKLEKEKTLVVKCEKGVEELGSMGKTRKPEVKNGGPEEMVNDKIRDLDLKLKKEALEERDKHDDGKVEELETSVSTIKNESDGEDYTEMKTQDDIEIEAGEITDKSKSILKEIQTLVNSKSHVHDSSEKLKEMDESAKEGKKHKTQSPKKLDIIDPDNKNEESSSEGSALSAMETFIKKSFSSKFDYKKGNIIISPNSSSDATIHARPQSASSSNNISGFESVDYLSRYKNFYAALNLSNGFNYGSPEKDNRNTKHGQDVKNGMKSKVNKDMNGHVSPLQSSDEEKSDGRNSAISAVLDGSSAPDKNKSLETKYLNIQSEASESKSEKNNKTSALDSLSSFVYGQTLTSEHPLDSLQRLITKSDIPKLVGGGSMVGGQYLPPHLQLHQSHLDLALPLNLCVPKSPKADSDEDETKSLRSPRSTRSRQDEDSLSDYEALNSPNSDGDPSEYRCAACSRRFASKGSYRYHLSRCHLSSVKRYGIKEAFNMSPYVYLPLDHTAKFSKYYEMAKELANRAKESKAS
ncbi:teashirt homolog 2-like isoform X2 [Dreissena polymorpha]|uniref:teashirt homolog 2-like isoform X2 n=1 Tax=Dreissena polymorpha TaxID=45954 RepID=UPI002265192E|nr:teashirt homolog 2-like isoform X2 [Dreissena polymorpha]